MTYGNGEALILSIIRSMTQFDAANSARGKWGLLNSGKAAQYAILKPGTNTRTMIAPTTRQNDYRTIIQLWQRYKDDGESLLDLEALISAVQTAVDAKKTLGDTTNSVTLADIIEAREIQEQWRENGPAWLMCELVVRWHEEENISYT